MLFDRPRSRGAEGGKTLAADLGHQSAKDKKGRSDVDHIASLEFIEKDCSNLGPSPLLAPEQGFGPALGRHLQKLRGLIDVV